MRQHEMEWPTENGCECRAHVIRYHLPLDNKRARTCDLTEAQFTVNKISFDFLNFVQLKSNLNLK